MKKVHIVSMGCVKNLVDSEVLTGQLINRRYQMTDNAADSDIIIINTCGFIEAAKQESIQAIFEALQLKNDKQSRRIFVAGCLTQRYKDQIMRDIPEVDGVFGTEDYGSILATLGDNSYYPEDMYRMRRITTPNHFAYIKISEGCNHTCSFCAIPGIRGKHRSRSAEDILSEAENLALQGVQELILVSQDTSYYGKDLTGRQQIVKLIESLAERQLFKWIRPLYWYPGNFPIAYIELMNRYESVIPYLDMPIQHASDRILGLMRRAETGASLQDLFKRIRSIRQDIALRTTVIVGHPGETPEDFDRLMTFIGEIRFDRLGSFVYSDEEGTHAFNLTGKVSYKVAMERQKQLMELQQSISRENNRKLIGSRQVVLIDEYNKSAGIYSGRRRQDAPEIDNEVIIEAIHSSEDLAGTFQEVEIVDASEYEVYGMFVSPQMKERAS